LKIKKESLLRDIDACILILASLKNNIDKDDLTSSGFDMFKLVDTLCNIEIEFYNYSKEKQDEMQLRGSA